MTKNLKKLQRYCDKQRITFRIQKLHFGYERAFLDFTDDLDGYYKMCRWLDRHKRTLAYDTEMPYSPLHFIGWIRVMPISERDEWLSLCKQDSERVEDWWCRYNAADQDTRKLMACGQII